MPDNEEQRADASRLFDAFFEQTSRILAILKADGVIVRINRAGLELGGATEEKAIGCPFPAAPWWGAATEPRRRAQDAVARAAAGEAVCYESELHRADGSPSRVELWLRPVRDAAGAVRFLAVEGRDVTRQTGTEAELRRNEAQLRRAQRVARLHHWEWTAERTGSGWRRGATIYSPGVEEIFGVSPAGLAAADVTYGEAFVHPDDRSRICRATRQILDGENHGYAFEYRIVRPDGTQRIVHELAEVETSRDGRVKIVAGTLQDITELRRTEEALRRSEQSLANAQRIAAIGSFRWEAATDSVEWSREVFRILDFDPDATEPTFELLLGRLHPDDRERVVTLIEKSLRRAAPRSFDYRIVLPDGAVRHLHEQTEVVCDPEGHVISMNGTIQDVTDRKREERALLQAKEQAEVASRSKGQFLANMSHELRTPLNAIIGFSEVMAGEMLGPTGAPRYATYARDILESGRHLLAVINDILEMSRIEAGTVCLNEAEVRLEPVAAAALRLVEQRADDTGIELVKDVPTGLPPVLADERLIRQAAINLLSNAVKFTHSGGRVAIRAGPASDGGLWLAVSDTGIGMAHESIATALEPFGQVDGSLGRRYEGAGLGLPLVKSIVELHQGSLTIDSAVGVGTTVTITLPPSRTLSPPCGRGRGVGRQRAAQ